MSCLCLGLWLSLGISPLCLLGAEHRKDREKWALQAPRVIDTARGRVLRDRVVLVDPPRIVGIVDQSKIPEGFSLIDLGDATILPGLIDAHVHPTIRSDRYQLDHLESSSTAKALAAVKALEKLLQAGWTTVRLAGTADVQFGLVDVARAIERGDFKGPRVYGALHYLSTTGGGGDLNFLSHEQKITADGRIFDGADEAVRLVRDEIKHGSDWIKVLVTGAFMSAKDNPRQVHVTPDELTAIVEEASRRGVPVMAHAHSAAGIIAAARAGVRSIEHGTFIDLEGTHLLRKKGIFLVPTLYVGDYFLKKYSQSKDQQKMIALTRKYRGEYIARVRRAYEKGVKLALGTDMGGYPEVSQHVHELVMYKRDLGLTSLAAIQAATWTNAQLLGREHELGNLEQGKLADILVVEGDPTKDLLNLKNVLMVMKGGEILHRTDGRRKSIVH